MAELFYRGGPGFMGLLTILLIVMVAWMIFTVVRFYSVQTPDPKHTLRQLFYSRSVGLFALVTGIFGQMIGLYMAFSNIEKAGDISAAVVFAGLKVSMITTLYGMFIFLLSLLLWFVASWMVERKMKS